jgi:hypothetical protein
VAKKSPKSVPPTKKAENLPQIAAKQPAAKTLQQAQVRDEAKAVEEIQLRMRAGAVTSPEEIRRVDRFMDGHGPGGSRHVLGNDDDDGEEERRPMPPDVTVTSMRSMAEALGVHYNTITNWKAKGIEPIGKSPFSVGAYLLILRPYNKLPECHPTASTVRKLWRWAFGGGEEGSANPDDPAHAPTRGWGEERDRQAALKERSNRKIVQFDLDKKRGALFDADEVRTRLRALRHLVVGQLSTVQHVANRVRGLNPTQRAELADELLKWQAEAKAKIAASSAALVKQAEAPRATG